MTTFDHGTCESLLSLFDPFVVFGRTTNQPNKGGELGRSKDTGSPVAAAVIRLHGFGRSFSFVFFLFA